MTRAEYETAMAALRAWAALAPGAKVTESKHDGSCFGKLRVTVARDHAADAAPDIIRLALKIGAMDVDVWTAAFRTPDTTIETTISRNLDAADYAPTCPQCAVAKEVS